MYSLEDMREMQQEGISKLAPVKNFSYRNVKEAYIRNEIDYETYSYLLLVSSRAGTYI